MEFYYDVTGPDRKKLVSRISEITGIAAIYKGAPSFAYQVGDYTISKDGTLSWPDLNDADPKLLSQREYMIELLMEEGFEPSYPGYEEDTKLAITVPFDKVAVGNLISLLEAKGDLIKKALGIDSIAIEMGDDAVTFPWFTDLEPDKVQTYTKFVSALCQMSIKQKRITAKPKATENEKYAFRCFLFRLGFIGDEYKADRKILLSKLDGSSAFKSGAKKGGEQ